MSYYPYIPWPEQSPWGEVQHCRELAYGIYQVSTAGHGGVMVHKDVARAALSKGALQRASTRESGFYCYEEDCAAPIPLRELLDNPKWKMPPDTYSGTREDFEKVIDQSLIHWNPDYVAYREKRGKPTRSKDQISFDDLQR